MRHFPFGFLGALCIALVVCMFAPPGSATDENVKNTYTADARYKALSEDALRSPGFATAAFWSKTTANSAPVETSAIAKIEVCIIGQKELCVEFMPAEKNAAYLYRTTVPYNADLGLSPPTLQNYSREAWNKLLKENTALARYSDQVDKLLDPAKTGACLTPVAIETTAPANGRNITYVTNTAYTTCGSCRSCQTACNQRSGSSQTFTENGYTYRVNNMGEKMLLTSCFFGLCIHH